MSAKREEYFETTQGKILLCTNNGCLAISPFHAKAAIFDVYDTIDNHFQLSKLFITDKGEIIHPQSAFEARLMGKKYTLNDHFILPNGWEIPSKYLYFGLKTGLWMKYLDEHPRLVKYISQFDGFYDPYAGHSPISDGECIQLYVKEGRCALKALSLTFFNYLDDPELVEFMDIKNPKR